MVNKKLTPNMILERIETDPFKETKSYIILGQSGPTGKTWLWNELRKRGLNATEISEQVYMILSYIDDKNHYIESGINNTVVIVLNRPLKKSSLSYKGVYF